MIKKTFTFITENFRELVLYGIIGGGAVVIDIGLYMIFVRLGGDPSTKSDLYNQVAHYIAVAVAVVYSFTLNSIFTFKKRDQLVKRFLSFAGVSAIGALVSGAIIFSLTKLGVNADVAKIIGLPFIFIVQFTLNRLTTFGDFEDHSDDNLLELAIEEGDII